MRTTLDLTGLSAKHRRLMALGIHGGDGDDPLDLDALASRVESIADLNDDDIATLRHDLEEVVDVLPDDPRAWGDDDLATANRVADLLATVTETENTRAEAADQRAAEAEALLARLRPVETPEGEPEVETPAAEVPDPEAEPAAEPEVPAVEEPEVPAVEVIEPANPAEETPPAVPERIAASAARPIRTRARQATTPRPRPGASSELVLTAAANVPGVPAREVLDTDQKIANAFLRTIDASEGYRGPRVEIPVMRLGTLEEVYPEERRLTRDAVENARKIDALTSLTALRASGGMCAPQQVNYDVNFFGTDARPVRDTALARFGADRGGIRTFPPILLTDVDDANAIIEWTNANDIALNNPSTKPCVTMTCPTEVETLVSAFPQCIKIGNFRQRFFPEQVRAWTAEVGVWASRVMERLWLTRIGAHASTTNVTVGTIFGTSTDIAALLDRLGAGIRSRNRLPDAFPIRLVAPRWLRDNMRTDIARTAYGTTAERLVVADAEVAAIFSSRGFNVTWALDGESGQEFGAQSDNAALLGWPSHAVLYAWPEGSWLHLDGGSIDFGIVRDSTLNSTNDFTIMSETFENVHFNGLESFRIDVDICPSGKVQAPASVDPCTLGS